MFIFFIAPASSGFWRSIALVETLVKNRRMKPMRESRAMIGRSSAPFRYRPRKTSSPKSSRTTPRMISGMKSHHMARMVPTRRSARDASMSAQATTTAIASTSQIQRRGMPDARRATAEQGGRVHHGTIPEGDEPCLPGCKDSLKCRNGLSRLRALRPGKRRAMTVDPIAILLEHGEEHGCVHHDGAARARAEARARRGGARRRSSSASRRTASS